MGKSKIKNKWSKKRKKRLWSYIWKFFDKNQGYQITNINYLFDKNLINHDNLYNDILVFIVGDNGGFTDYILYYTINKKGYFSTIFVIPEKNNFIKNGKFRREIKDKTQ